MSIQLRFPRPYLAEGEIEIPTEVYEQPYRQRIRELRRELVLPGFRPGQVPAEVVMAKHGEALLTELLTQYFLQALDEGLGGRRLVGFPYYIRRPEELRVQPPFPSYRYEVRALVVPSEALSVEGIRPIRYLYQAQEGDVALYQRYLRVAFGQLEPLDTLPAVLPVDKEVIVRLRWEAPSAFEPIRLSWTTLSQPFPWTYIAERKVGEKLQLPPQALLSYVDLIRAELPDFSPLTVEDVSVTVVSAAQVSPLSLEELVQQLDLSSFEGMSQEEIWKALLDRQVNRLLQGLNTRSHQIHFLHAAGVRIPEDLVQYNYLLYLRERSGNNGHLRSYEEYRLDLAWQIFFASYAFHEPALAISDEEVQNEVWDRLKTAPDLSPEAQELLLRLESSEDERKGFLETFIGKQGESLRRSMQLVRFDEWLTTRFGPAQEQYLPLNVLSLRLL
ncbi:MAG: trigger factor family protein [Bacteroidia bacterium]|nr:trigger factor family protein [Bacteroidia bacterium]